MHARQVDIPSFPDTRWILKCKHVLSVDICSFCNLFYLLMVNVMVISILPVVLLYLLSSWWQ